LACLPCGFIAPVVACNSFVTVPGTHLMTDQTVGLTARPRFLRLRAVAGQCLRPAALTPSTAWAGVVLVMVLLGRYCWRQEGDYANIFFTAAVTMSLMAFLIVVSRRALFATVLTASMVAVILLAASVKQATMNAVVHAYDLVFYLRSWSTLSYL
jgi:hypothetical protein